MKRLILMRHGKSSWGDKTDTDHARPLSPRGLRDAPLMASWLNDQGWQPDLIISSNATRTVETAEYCAGTLGISTSQIQRDARLYEAAADEILGVIQSAPAKVRTLMIVGHNPGLEKLIEGLNGKAIPVARKQKVFPTAAVARFVIHRRTWRFQIPDCELVDIVRPKTLNRA